MPQTTIGGERWYNPAIPSQTLFEIYDNGSGVSIAGNLYLGGTIASAGGLALVGFGFPVQVQELVGTGATSTVTLTFTPPKVSMTYMALIYAKCTAVTGGSWNITASFVDETSTQLTNEQVNWIYWNSATVHNGVGSPSAPSFMSQLPYIFWTDASGSTISINLVLSGTITADYNIRLFALGP